MVPFQPGSQVRQRPSATVQGCWPLHWPHLGKGREARRGPEPPHPPRSAHPPPRPLRRPAPLPSSQVRGPRLPAAAAQAVEAGRARLPAVLAPVARLAGARAVHRVAAAAKALAVALAARAKRALAALAAAALLLARRRVAGALIVAAAAPPACVAQARARLWVTARRGAAVTRAGALRAPPARLAATRAAPRVAHAMLALARMLAACAPAPRVTRTLACHVLALPMRVADTQLLAVGAPELARALCRAGHGGCQARVLAREPGASPNLPASRPPPLGTLPHAGSPLRIRSLPIHGPCPTAQRPPPQPLLTGVTVGTEVAMAAAALARPHAHFILRARGVAFAHRCGQDAPELLWVTCPQTIPSFPCPCPLPRSPGCPTHRPHTRRPAASIRHSMWAPGSCRQRKGS